MKQDRLFFKPYLDTLCHHSPTIKRSILEYGGKPLHSFFNHFIFPTTNSYQKQDDLFIVIHHYIAPLLGEAIANQSILNLKRFPVVMTANHHGVDYFAQSVQSSLLFFLMNSFKKVPSTSTIIFAFGNVPLNNLTFPRGLLLYDVEEKHIESIPKKFPIFPESFKGKMVSATPGFNKDIIFRALDKLDQLKKNHELSSTSASVVNCILQDYYLRYEVINQPNYSSQSVILNNRLWKRLFFPATYSSELVYLEIEQITNQLLELDLNNPESLAYKVLFDADLREKVLEKLDGVKGCWQRNSLLQNCSENYSNKIGCGTTFFWGIDRDGRHFPLCLGTNPSTGELLFGIDNKGNKWGFSYNPESLIENIKKQNISPSLFTCFLLICFARGIICIGGYYQAVYLPTIQQGLASALRASRSYSDISPFIEQIPTDYYLSGMQAVMGMIGNNFLVPAGPLEIIARGGLPDSDLNKILSIPVKEAHLASLIETLPDIAPQEVKDKEWKKFYAFNCNAFLKHKLVTLC